MKNREGFERKSKVEIRDHGLTVFKSRNQEIRRLKRLHSPSCFGYRVWTSSWLLVDFLRHRRLPEGTRVMEVGCGWGLAGIYCAKQYGSLVTCADIDSEVFPYVRLHADLNQVKVATLAKGFQELTGRFLEGYDLLIGSDICFWYTLVDSLTGLIQRALDNGVRLVLIADPGRPSFDDLSASFIKDGRGQLLNWQVSAPHPIEGRILQIGSLS